MPGSTKRRKAKPPPTVVHNNVAPLYNEDIGSEGTKTKRRFSVSQAANETIFRLPIDDQEQRRRQKRMKRFVEHNQKNSSLVTKKKPTTSSSGFDSIDFDIDDDNEPVVDNHRIQRLHFVGESTALEKPYVRLTAAPKAEDVRPLSVLRKSLAHAKAHYIQNEDFDFTNEQLKSIRQDITVQHLRNNFVLEVYETHSRILLEHGDLNEFNQCQTMIQSLTNSAHAHAHSHSSGAGAWEDTNRDDAKSARSGIRTNPKRNANANANALLVQSEEAADEFRAYSLMYDLVQNSWCDLKIHIRSTRNRTDVAAFSRYNGAASHQRHSHHSTTKSSKRASNHHSQQPHRTPPPITRGSSVRHALSVVNAIINDDYLAFFRLYKSAPHMSAYLMDFLVRRARNVGYSRIIAAFRPTISTEGFREALSFRDLEETRQFLKDKRAVFLNDKQDKHQPPFWIDCKATYAVYLKRAK
mmetsp:Transcript_20850/g.45392  ORF Transcript_20850/g.45392 Transcript_20850/m.45392 type:complete len:468 (-) Transcript_20850:359-1762(-)|eukprot:CAMPEP_0168175540 /NCGR_PEP_ID=MMETSP0139_2-20121125/7196_1 /TAXON_ID=44445 /ORGANISM="Pseudo-nitzschia australis, Strain 10249 10 AB" /LENGTH=467 /DNA_ID=CAMNT_0008093973 /DNA_START=296 /DNA_END=1699 /DNA_ORIENTATION=+